MLCVYGCNQEAKFQLKNGKWCCSEKHQSCPEIRKKNSSGASRSYLEGRGINRTYKVCEYCNSNISLPNYKRHTKKCYVNPKNLKYCPVCNKIIKQVGNVTCSQGCARKYFNCYSWGVDKLRAYSTICFRFHKKKCVVCGEDKAVVVHHFDYNHKNNDPKNLIPLCPTHHSYLHNKDLKDLISDKIEEYVAVFTKSYCGGI